MNAARYALALLIAAPTLASAAPVGVSHPVAPDFSTVDSVEKAKALAAEGKLVPILLFPAEFGGAEDPANIVYVPPEAADAKTVSTRTLIRMVEAGQINKLTVEPDYKGRSVVPSRIVLKASHSDKPGGIDMAVEIW